MSSADFFSFLLKHCQVKESHCRTICCLRVLQCYDCNLLKIQRETYHGGVESAGIQQWHLSLDLSFGRTCCGFGLEANIKTCSHVFPDPFMSPCHVLTLKQVWGNVGFHS